MDKWAAPLFIIILFITGVILFFTQGKGKDTPQLPDANSTFNLISVTPAQGLANATNQQQGQQQQPQQQQQQQTQQQQQPYGVEEQLKASYSATIKTSKGIIKVVLRADAAPNTVKNFIVKADNNYYNNLIFHRVEDWVIQGGDPKGDGSGGGQMLSEINPLPFTAGSLGVARRDDIRISNDSQFFITKTDASWLNQQYTNFGQVTDGMDVVQKIAIGDKILSISVDK